MIEIVWSPASTIFALQLVVSTLLPLLVGIVTTKVTSPARKAVWLAALAAVTAIVSAIASALVNGTPLDLVQLVLGAFASFVVAVATYFGVWSRPTASGESVSAKIVGNVGRTAEPASITSLPAPPGLGSHAGAAPTVVDGVEVDPTPGPPGQRANFGD